MKTTLVIFLWIALLNSNLSQAAGCSLHSFSSDDSQYRIVDFPGNEKFSAHFHQITGAIAAEFELDDESGFDHRIFLGMIDDAGSPNAYATNSFDLNGIRYAVLFGQNLLAHLAIPTQTGSLNTIKIEAVLAHEFAHIFQYQAADIAANSGYSTLAARLLQAPTIQLELMADMLTGWYLAERYRVYDNSTNSSSYPASNDVLVESDNLDRVLHQFYSIGDFNFNDPDHHGTPEQRLEAVISGLKLKLDKRIDDPNIAFATTYEKYIGSFPQVRD